MFNKISHVVILRPWGDGLDPNYSIDRTWFLQFPDQLFKCYNILTVGRLEVKPV